MTFFRRISALVILSGFTLSPLVGCDKTPAPGAQRGGGGPQAPVEVRLARSMTGPVERTIEVVGTLFGDEEAQISAKVAGEIVEIRTDVGDIVEPGEALAQIDPVTYRLLRDQARMSLQQALAMLGLSESPGDEEVNINRIPTVVQKRLQADNSRRRYERAQQLFNGSTGSISEQEYTDLRTAAEVAQSEYDVQRLEVQSQLADARVRQAELRVREQRLSDTTVRAPGPHEPATQPVNRRYTVTARQVSLGEYMREGTPMFRVVADNPIKYRASVPERYLASVQVGQPVRLRVDGRDESFTGRIARLNPQVDSTSRTFLIEAVFDNAQRALRPGQFARGAIITGTDQQATFVPADAVVAFAGIVRVFTVRDGKAVEHRVTIGQRDGDRVEITSGFSGEGEVVVRGGSRLADGVPVKLADSTPPATSGSG